MQDLPKPSATARPSLRERRRLQTEREIQLATLSLARELGFEAVTTQAIAQRAGISPRTFFNFFPNKEAAAIGRPPPFPADAVEAFRTGTGPLADDLRRLMRRHAAQLAENREIIEGVGRLARDSLALRQLHDRVMMGVHDDLVEVIAARAAGQAGALGLAPRQAQEIARPLAEIAILVARSAVDRWLDGAEPDLPAAADAAWDRVLAAARLLIAG